MHGVFNSQAYGVWTILYPDYNRLIGGIGGLSGVIVLLPVALYISGKANLEELSEKPIQVLVS